MAANRASRCCGQCQLLIAGPEETQNWMICARSPSAPAHMQTVRNRRSGYNPGPEPDHAQRLGLVDASARVSAVMRGYLAGIGCC